MLSEATDFISVIEINAARYADVPMFRLLARGEDVTDTLTYGDLHERALRAAGAVQEATPPDARVLLAFQPGLELAVAFVGVMLAGRVPVAVTPLLFRDPARLRAISANAGPALLLCGDGLLDGVRSALEGIGAGYRAESLSGILQGTWDWRHPGRRSESVAFLQYTSGSTASPKGVVVTHANLLHNLRQIEAKFGLTSSDVSVSWLPPYHDMGLIGGILEPLYVGLQTILMPPQYFIQKPLRWLRAAERFGGTATGGPNFALQMCVDSIGAEEAERLSLRSLRLLFTGSERIRPATLEAFEQRFRASGLRKEVFYPCYGLAESTLISTGGVAGKGYRLHYHSGLRSSYVSCGTSIASQELRVVRPGTGELCGEEEVGEILIGSPSVTGGYYGDKVRDAELFHSEVGADGSPRRLLRTGDLGFLQDGELFVTGRLKEVLIIRGKTHYPQDLEEAVEALDDRINRGGVACFAVENESTEGLVVYCELRRRRRKEFVRAELAAAVAAMLGRLHGLAPLHVGFLDERALPRTTSGKLMRLKLREEHLAGTLVEAAETLSSS
jgi:acyl-CoA synthetase (AMP-forming)/AMP-acid ligase II